MGPQSQTADGWGRWISGAVSHLIARIDHLDRQHEATAEQVMQVRERLALVEKHASSPSPVPSGKVESKSRASSVEELIKAGKELGTAALWLTTFLLGLAHWAGWLSDAKVKAIMHLLTSGS